MGALEADSEVVEEVSEAVALEAVSEAVALAGAALLGAGDLVIDGLCPIQSTFL